MRAQTHLHVHSVLEPWLVGNSFHSFLGALRSQKPYGLLGRWKLEELEAFAIYRKVR